MRWIYLACSKTEKYLTVYNFLVFDYNVASVAPQNSHISERSPTEQEFQNVKKISNCQKDVKCQNIKQLD